MALEFLTKKKWNPSNVKNREQVWLREQAAEKEKKKLAELQKQLQEERRRAELKKLQTGDSTEDSIESRRVDWIYEMPVNDEKKNEDYLTGKAVYDLYKNEKDAQRDLEDKKIAGSAFMEEDDISNPNEIQRRINEDPLMLIRKKEMELTRNRLSNPQRIMKLAAMLQAKGSDIRLDFNDMKAPDHSDRSRATFRKGIQKAVSESESESESSDNYTTSLKKKTSPKPPLRRRSVSRDRHHRRHRRQSRSRSRSRSSRRHRHHPSRSSRSRSRSRSRSSRRHRHHSSRSSRSSSKSSSRHRREGQKEMTKEQVMERLRQMQQDATIEEEDRKKRLEEESKREEEEKRAPTFLAKMNKSAFDEVSYSKRMAYANRQRLD